MKKLIVIALLGLFTAIVTFGPHISLLVDTDMVELTDAEDGDGEGNEENELEKEEYNLEEYNSALKISSSEIDQISMLESKHPQEIEYHREVPTPPPDVV